MVKFSIIVPMRDAEGFVGDALDSVRGQGISDYEIIVVDDHSGDGSVGVVKGWMKKNPGVRVRWRNWRKGR